MGFRPRSGDGARVCSLRPAPGSSVGRPARAFGREKTKAIQERCLDEWSSRAGRPGTSIPRELVVPVGVLGRLPRERPHPNKRLKLSAPAGAGWRCHLGRRGMP